MSNTSDVGISPVLLQAISQSLSSTSPKSSSTVDIKMEHNDPSPTASGAADQTLIARLASPKQETGSYSQTSQQSDAIKTMLKLKMAANALQRASAADKTDVTLSGTSASDLAMASVLTAFASQRGLVSTSSKGGNISETVSSQAIAGYSNNDGNSEYAEEVQYRAVQVGDRKILIRTKPSSEQLASFEKKIQTTSDVYHEMSPEEAEYTYVKPDPDSEDSVEGHSHMQRKPTNVLITNTNFNPNVSDTSQDDADLSDRSTMTPVSSGIQSPEASKSDSGGAVPTQLVFSFNPVPSTSEIPLEGRLKVIEHDGKRYIIQTHDYDPVSQPSNSQDEHTYTVQMASDEDSMAYTSVAEQEVVTVGQIQESQSGMRPTYDAEFKNPNSVNIPGISGTGRLCPVCGDNVSGFHYGIFTCESCKGFFKRTVQNKKTFVCPRSGECEIMLENRKKCPACRFAKCLVMGMKLEAIRQDRTRGGRSNYGGSSPFEEKKKRPIKIIQRRPSYTNDSHLASVLNSGTTAPMKPFVPQILTDIMNLESLLCDDDIPSGISAEDFTASNPNVFLTLLQLCELKLYKIVRWARNLPYFANISTDDQILLLQNCWCELLALTLCWKSLQLTNEVVFFHGQAIDYEKACSLDLGEMFNKMLAVVEQFKRLKVDQYECVALKVIILICPDIKGLNDAEKLSEQQQKVSMALDTYTGNHYRQNPSKYGEILLRLPELSRISGMLKDHLMNWMPANTQSCGLLYELLKGENMKDLV